MRRTFPQKVKPVPSRTDEQEATTARTKQALPDNNRRVRTSAAMIGLAISMGAYNLPIPRQSDSATAAEPAAGESTVSPADSFETAALSPEATASHASPSELKPLSVKHTVQEGQTLWEVARFYGADAAAIALANNLSVDAVLRVGQVLIIPTDSRIAQAAVTSDTAAIIPGYYGPVAGSLAAIPIASASPTTLPSPVDANLKVKQEEALKNLQQKRESLRAGLATLPSDESSSVKPVSQKVSSSNSADEARVNLPSLVTSEQKSEKTKLPTALPSSEQTVAFGSVRNPQSAVRSNPATLPENGIEDLVNYRVNQGDTLATIARAHGISLQQLVQANRITNPNYIFANQVLVIPQNQTASGATQKFKGSIASVPASPKSLDVSGSSSQSLVAPAVSQETKVAAVSSFAPETALLATNSDAKVLQSNNVANLKSEIEKLREKYGNQAQANRPQVQDVSVAVTSTASLPTVALNRAGDRINPEFNPERYSNLNSRIREMRERIRAGQAPQAKDVSQPLASSSESKPQLVAAASVGSESYDPLVQSRLGKTVSPELPPLGPGNEYLPGAPGKFEGYIWPTKGVLTSGFGWRWGRMHKGIDIAGPVGTPVVAAADGVVVTAGWNSGGYGYLVEIQHPDGSLTLYAHNSRILVQVGQQVAQGQQISEMGSTGYSTGPHCHFEVHPSGRGAVNPMAFLPRDRG